MKTNSKTKKIDTSKLMQAIGLTSFRNALLEVQSEGEQILKNTQRARNRKIKAIKFADLQSHIPARKTYLRPNSVCLIIDVGGTNTKVSTCVTNSRRECRWNRLFELPNFHFRPKKIRQQKIVAFADRVFSEVALQLSKKPSLNTLNIGMAVIWSNGADIKTLNKLFGTKGIDAVVASRKTGYNKGEWFVEDLKDGDHIGSVFLSAAKSHGINPSVFVIGNDTIFTATALPGSNGAVIASTGANATGLFKGCYVNQEMGGCMKLPAAIFTPSELKYFTTNPALRKSARNFECAMAGKWMAAFFIANLNAAAKIIQDPKLTKEVKNLSAKKDLSNKSLAEMYLGRLKFTNHSGLKVISDSILSLMLERAASLGGIMAYLAIADQLKNKKPLRIALDSSFARGYGPDYMKIFNRQLKKSLRGRARASATLLRPLLVRDDAVSVPTQGAMYATELLSSAK